jgi:hypothetical protein
LVIMSVQFSSYTRYSRFLTPVLHLVLSTLDECRWQVMLARLLRLLESGYKFFGGMGGACAWGPTTIIGPDVAYVVDVGFKDRGIGCLRVVD